jgi:hypothetical protein
MYAMVSFVQKKSGEKTCLLFFLILSLRLVLLKMLEVKLFTDVVGATACYRRPFWKRTS